MTQVEELKVIIGMLPIWTTGIVFFAVLAQFSSTFLEQGRSMNKSVGAFAIPPASLASFDAVSVLIWVPVYDRVLVPAARRLTGSARGISELQRYGAGLLVSVLVMATAALVETRRLALALAVPLVAGGLFCLKLFVSGAPELVVPGLLVFYGIALLNGSKYTLDEIKYLGLTQIALGLVALLVPQYGLLLFGAGFGLGHIGYGLLMYNRYERPAGAKFAAP